MNTNKIFFTLLTIMTACFMLACSQTDTGQTGPIADLVIHNGTIYTMDESAPTAEAVAVTDGKIVFVGSAAEVLAMRGYDTEELDLQGRTMSPGLIETHGHFMGQGNLKLNLNLMAVANFSDIVEMVAVEIAKSAPGEWINGRGWHQDKWTLEPTPMVKSFPTHDKLSEISPDNPVYLRHASGHMGFANAKAMEIAGITNDTPDPSGGEIIRNLDGTATGMMVERAQGMISRFILDSTPETDRRALELAVQDNLEHGITSFQDMGSGQEAIDLYKEFMADGKLGVRLWVMLRGNEELLSKWYETGPEIGLGNNFLTIRAIKLASDGALGSRGAWLLEDYEDRAGHAGFSTTPMSYVNTVARDALANGFQLGVHAIGDRANREVLDQYEEAFKDNPTAAVDARFRIEHAQHIDPEDIPRFGELGVIAAMQGIHMSSDRPWAIDRLGEKRIVEGAYMWQALLESGAKVINGTDVPVEPVDPIASFYATVTRRTLAGMPEGGYEPAQRMTREQALRSYTLDAAFGGFEEDIKGSIEVGKLADFTIFSQDIMTVANDDILKTKVDYTIVDGKIMFERNK